MHLVVGLGNPGRQYVGTRHNIGFDVVDHLAVRLGWITTASQFDSLSRSNFEGLTMDGTMTLADGAREKVLLLKPLTYMNLSGRSAQAAMAFYQLGPADAMFVLDDLALPCGKIRLRAGGSSGGHNGLRDVERALGTAQYPRLRLGVDAPPMNVPGRDYVLGRFDPAQREKMDPAVDRAASAIIEWIDRGIASAMNKFNADDNKKESED